MQIKGIEFFNVPQMEKGPKLDGEIGNFLEILNPLMAMEEVVDDSLLDLDTELIDLILTEDEEKEEDDSLAMILNMPWMGIREIKTPILIDETLEEIGEIEEVAISEEDIINSNKAEDLPQEDIFVLGKEVELSNKDIELDEDSFMEKGIDTKDVKTKEKANKDFVGFSKEDLSIFEEKDKSKLEDNIPLENLSKEDMGKDIIKEKDISKEKDIEFKDNQWSNISLRQIQNNSIKTNTNINFQEETILTENIERVSESIIKLMETSVQGDTKVMKVKLYPEELGSVDITLKIEEGELVAKILVDNDHVRQLFMDNIQQLNQSLVKQNIQIGDMQVDLNNSSHGNSEQNNKNPFTPNKNFNISNRIVSNTSIQQSTMSSGEISILA